MSSDRPSHEEVLLKELAALDEVLRQPVEPAPPPASPPDVNVKAPPHPAGPARNHTVPSRERTALRRERSAPSRDRAAPSRDRAATSRNLAVPSRQTEALRAHAGPPESIARLAERGPRAVAVSLASAAVALSSRRLRLGVLGLVALGVGLLIGWNAVNFIVAPPPPESTASAVDPVRPPAVPVAKARGPSRSARRTTPPPAERPAAAPRSVSKPAIVPPPAAALGNAATIVAEIPIAPAPSIDVRSTAAPLTGAPLPATRSMPPAAPPAVAAAGTLAAMAAADEAAIKTTLRRYEDAYERLDAKAAVEVWPTVDQRLLSRAFAGLASQTLDMHGCEVVVRAGTSTATASCSGTAEYVRKVGDTRVRVEPRQWTFTLNKTQGAWRIEAVDGSR